MKRRGAARLPPAAALNHMDYSEHDDVPSHLQATLIAAAKANRTDMKVEEV